MAKALLLLVLAVEMGASFGNASAELVSTSSNAIEVELRVEVTVSAEAVVAHLVFEDRPELTLPLLHRGGGEYGIITELEPVNYRLVFEIIGPDPARSEQRSLMELGLVFAGDGDAATTTTQDVDRMSDENRGWLWLAIAFGAAALSALAFWALGGDQSSGGASSGTDGAGDFD